MTRVSTAANYQSALLDLMSAQTRAQEAQERVSTQKVATDLTGFGRSSEALTALKSAQSRIQGFMDTGDAVAARLSAQDLAFERVAQGADGARQAIADALASGRVDGLMLELQGHFQIAKEGLNTKHQGQYLFGGGNVGDAPVQVGTLAELSLTAGADVFANGTLKQVSRLDEGTTVETGFLADEVGEALFEVFRQIQNFHAVTPVTGQPDQAMKDFLTERLKEFDEQYQAITNQAALNGSLQNRVESVLKSQEAQKTSLDELVSGRTDADLAQALTDLELSQVAIQASAQVINQLRQVSLLNFLN